MSLIVPQGYNASFNYSNWQAAPPTNSASLGTAVTPGTSNAEGSWTEIASSANVAQDCAGFSLSITTNCVSGQLKSFLLDLSIDPAGGTDWDTAGNIKISNLVCGNANSSGGAMGFRFLFPLFVKAGSSVAVRVQGSHATPTTSKVGIELFGRAKWPAALPLGMFVESIGTPQAASIGQAVTPGNAGWGSYADLGTTTNNTWWWQLSPGAGLQTQAAEYTFFELSFGDASNKHVIMRDMFLMTVSEDVSSTFSSNSNLFDAYCNVPAGSNIYVRAYCNNAPNAGYTAMAFGVGG